MMISLTHAISGFKWHQWKSVPIIIQCVKRCLTNGSPTRTGLGLGLLSHRSPRPMWKMSSPIARCQNRSIHGRGKETRLILEHEYAVEKDTVLYRHNNKRFFKLLNVFAMSQFFFWTYLSHFAFTMMRNLPVREEDKNNPNLPWWKKINFGKFRHGITVGCFMIGWGTMAIAWMYTLRCVRCLVLKKGGEQLVFVTFSPFSRSKYMSVPLTKVSARQSRLSSKVYLPLKVQGKYMFYILDMQGEFLNTRLFDYSAGLQRNWAK